VRGAGIIPPGHVVAPQQLLVASAFGGALPGTTLPGTTLPGTTLPGTTLPGTTLPGSTETTATATLGWVAVAVVR